MPSITSGTFPRAKHSSPGGRNPLRRIAAKVWAFLLDLGEHRGRGHLYALAKQLEPTNPALARSLRESAQHVGEV